jgi:hypothetical protein
LGCMVWVSGKKKFIQLCTQTKSMYTRKSVFI